MKKIIRKTIAILLVFAMLFSLACCGDSSSEEEFFPDGMMEGMEGMEGMIPGFGLETEVGEAEEEGSSYDIVTQDIAVGLSSGNGVYLYDYDTTFTSTASNFVIIRMDDEELLSKDLYITDVDIASYSGDYEFEDEVLEIVGIEIDDPIKINQTTMQTYWAKGEDNSDVVGNFTAVSRDDDGEYFEVVYDSSLEAWVEKDNTVIALDSDDEVYIGLPLYNAGSYKVEITFEICDSEDAYDFGYFEKEIEDGEEFTLTANSKIEKASATITILPQIFDSSDPDDGTTTYSSQYILLSDETISEYIEVTVDGEEDTYALYEVDHIADYEEAYIYIYNEDSLSSDSSHGSSVTLQLAYMDTNETPGSVDEDNHIEDNDLVWVNYEFTIETGKLYAFDIDAYQIGYTDVGTTISTILAIDYGTDDFASETNIETARSRYNSLSSAEQAYLLTLSNTDILAFDEVSTGDDADLKTWLSQTVFNYSGYDLIAYLEAGEEYMAELAIVDDFYEVLQDNDLWDDDSDAILAYADFNSESSIMTANLAVVSQYIDELSSEEIVIILDRASTAYSRVLDWEKLVVSEDVEQVKAEIMAIVYEYFVSDKTNAVLYVDDGTLGTSTTKIIYNEELFENIQTVSTIYEYLSPEKKDMVAEDSMIVYSSYTGYFKSSLYEYDSDYGEYTISYVTALEALEEMMQIARYMQEVVSYLDYFTDFDSEIAQDRFVDLIYGTSRTDLNGLIYGTEYSLFTGSSYDVSKTNYAIYDFVNAYGESDEVLSAIASEYIEFIDLIVYIEEYKELIAEEFKALAILEISTDEDYSDQEVSAMRSVLDDYIDAIMEENVSFLGSDSITNVIDYIFTEGFEDIDEAKGLVEDCFDIDEMLDQMISQEGYTN